MKKIMLLFLTAAILLTGTACGQQAQSVDMKPEVSQMKSICELAVMECYYHNVAKYKEEDAEGILWWQKDKHFWIEYSGVVTLGIDASLVSMEVDNNQVTITIPEATVLNCKVDSNSLNEDSYIVDMNSADINAEDEVKAFEEAQLQLEKNASSDRALLADALQRAQSLLEDYVTNIGNAIGKEYVIKWVYLDSEGSPLEAIDDPTLPEGSDGVETSSSQN